MTPKEKAKELVEKTFCFYLGDDGKGNESYTDKLECLRAADKCANEIFKYMYEISFSNRDEAVKHAKYWKEVKQELEKLL